jgi:hypothetical protein
MGASQQQSEETKMDTGLGDVQRIQQSMFEVNKRIAAKRQQLSKLKGCGASAKFSVKALQKDIDCDTRELFDLQRRALLATTSTAPAPTTSSASSHSASPSW